jgi:hypothetical protein
VRYFLLLSLQDLGRKNSCHHQDHRFQTNMQHHLLPIHPEGDVFQGAIAWEMSWVFRQLEAHYQKHQFHCWLKRKGGCGGGRSNDVVVGAIIDQQQALHARGMQQ